MKNLRVIFFLFLLISCNKENIIEKKAPSKDLISFGYSSAIVKTEYDSEDDSQINWLADDKVTVYCNEAKNYKQATYTVVTTLNKKSGKFGTNANGLEWGEPKDHVFYGVYPSNLQLVHENGTGIMTVPIKNSQVCDLGTKVGNNYETKPDMSNAIMVAYNSVYPKSGAVVNLAFNPIMTTIKLVVKGRPNEKTIITGVSIHFNNNSGYFKNGEFRYDVKDRKLVAWQNNTALTTKESIFIGINDGNLNSVELNSNETVTLTAFLPPITIDSSNPIEIMVHTPGESAPILKEKNTIKPASKGTIRLRSLPETKKGNNWITPLDDNIYVSQLSIPGTHDTGTGHGTKTASNEYRTQDMTFEQQWNIGIRVFDIRTGHSTFWSGASVDKWDDMWLWHGDYRTHAKLKEHIIDVCINKLNTYPNEFVILQLKNEGGKYIEEWKKWIGDMMNYLIQTYPDRVLTDFKEDLTVGDVRGKILFLARNVNNSEPYNNGPVGAYISIFPDNTTGQFCENALTFKNGKADLYVQDYFKPGSDKDGKNNAVKKAIDFSSDFISNATYKHCWMINFFSGYTKLIPNNAHYRENAQNVNLEMYKYITNRDKKVGPLGMCMIDWVGSRNSEKYIVFGDLLPQAIIDNNYKCRMNRKGE